MVDIIGRAKVIAETLIDEQQAKVAGKKAGDAVAKGGKEGGDKFGDNFDASVGSKIPKLALGLGVAAGAAIATGIGQSLQRDATGKRFAASLGLDAKDAAELNESAAAIYKDAWGASFEDVQRGVAATKSSFKGLGGEELTQAARNAQIFADVFEVDVVQAAGVASVAVKQGLAKDAVEAFDLMTRAAQQVPLQFRDELLEAVTEYSQFFSQIGIDGPEAFGLLASAAELGQYGIDKTGDAIKEFGIRAIDTSKLTAEAFATLNLDIATMQDALLAGGDEGEAAFRKIVEGLDQIKDPSEQAATAIALFGTPVEDLGNEKIPAFVEALANGTEGLEDFKGATEETGAVASDTFTVKAQGWGRSLNLWLGEAIDTTTQSFKGMGPVIDDWADNIGSAIGSAIDWVEKYIRQVARIPEAPKRLPGNTVSANAADRGSAVGGPARGLTLVGERGPELVEFPNGSYVHSSINSERMVAASGGGGDTFNITHIGNVDGLIQKLDWRSRYRRVGAG